MQQEAELREAEEFIVETYTAGTVIHHKSLGDGVIKQMQGTQAIIAFGASEKLLDLKGLIGYGLIECSRPNYRDILKDSGEIGIRSQNIQKEYEQYADLLD